MYNPWKNYDKWRTTDPRDEDEPGDVYDLCIVCRCVVGDENDSYCSMECQEIDEGHNPDIPPDNCQNEV